MPYNYLIFALIFILIAGILAYTIRIVPQAEAYVIERLGAYNDTWTTGVHFVMPFIDRIANKVTLKEIVKDFDPQPVITKDNVTMQ
ncbi:MAG: peptidase, partial [Erysipelotrichaceae bacterium]|nr:peptidase [Erysipelotrichaceae bacterium]